MMNMKMSPKEAKELTNPTPADAPQYPYGLSISLDEEAMQKLGITALPKVGESMQLVARVEVCSTSQYSTQGGEQESNLSLQITDMELAPEQQKQDSASVLYGNSGGSSSGAA